MSQCLAEGQFEARFYPIGMLVDEATVCVRRVNHRLVSEVILLRSAIISVLSKKGDKPFRDAIKQLIET